MKIIQYPKRRELNLFRNLFPIFSIVTCGNELQMKTELLFFRESYLFESELS